MKFRKKRGRTICVVKTKALIRFAVTAKLICVFDFAYAKSQFSHDAAYIRHTLLSSATLTEYQHRILHALLVSFCLSVYGVPLLKHG